MHDDDAGKGDDTFTSGFEGPWTRTPTTWNNEYFQNLLDFTWDKHVGPGGHWQWNATNATTAGGLQTADGQKVMMLTTDQVRLCVRALVRLCVCAFVRACVFARVRACVRMTIITTKRI